MPRFPTTPRHVQGAFFDKGQTGENRGVATDTRAKRPSGRRALWRALAEGQPPQAAYGP